MSGYTKEAPFVISNGKAFTGPLWSSKTKHLSINNRTPKEICSFSLSGSGNSTSSGCRRTLSSWCVRCSWLSPLGFDFFVTFWCWNRWESWMQERQGQPLGTWLPLAVEKRFSSFVSHASRVTQSWQRFGPQLLGSSARVKPEIYGLLVLDPGNTFSPLEDERVVIFPHFPISCILWHVGFCSDPLIYLEN